MIPNQWCPNNGNVCNEPHYAAFQGHRLGMPGHSLQTVPLLIYPAHVGGPFIFLETNWFNWEVFVLLLLQHTDRRQIAQAGWLITMETRRSASPDPELANPPVGGGVGGVVGF